MNKAIPITLLTIIFSGCGSDSSDTDIHSDPVDTNDPRETRTISSVGGSYTIDSEDVVDLSVGGVNNTIHVESDIGVLLVSGISNLFYFSSGVVVEECHLSGTDNFAEKEEDVSLNCSGSGAANTGF